MVADLSGLQGVQSATALQQHLEMVAKYGEHSGRGAASEEQTPCLLWWPGSCGKKGSQDIFEE
jgi:hypothetical protein